MAIIIDEQRRIFTLQTKQITATSLFCLAGLTEVFQAIHMRWENATEHILWIPFHKNTALLELVTIG